MIPTEDEPVRVPRNAMEKELMNATFGRCGHSIIAVGAPGSAARAKSETNFCPSCAKRLLFEMARDIGTSLANAIDGGDRPVNGPTVICGVCKESEVNHSGISFCHVCHKDLCDDCSFSEDREHGIYFCEECHDQDVMETTQ